MKPNFLGHRRSRPNWKRLVIYGILGAWILGVSGIFGGSGTTPGIWQALQLFRLRDQRAARLTNIETRILELESEKTALTSNPDRIELEIRRQLGLVRPDEILVEFR